MRLSLLNKPLNFNIMCLGFSGSPMSLKSKADALKYAIEFTSTGEYPNRVPDMTKAKELFDFICENVQLPDVETDQLSNSLNGFTSLMEKLSKKNEETQEKVNEESEPTGEVIGEQTKEEAIPLPGSSPLSHVANKLRSILRDNKFKAIGGAGANDYSEETFRLDGNGEYFDVTITHSACPKKE
jgi:hypothetical protein